MKKTILIMMTMLIVSQSYCYAVAYYFPVIKRMQPDGTVFYASEQGSDDGFEWITLDGYSYTMDVNTKYFHYLKKNAHDEIVTTQYKVGIDDPENHGIQKNIQSILKKQAVPENTITVNKPAFTTPISDSVSIGVYCIQFNDRAGRCSSSDIENMLFEETGGSGYTRSDSEENFGSMSDYWNEMSGGDLIVYGEIIKTAYRVSSA